MSYVSIPRNVRLRWVRPYRHARNGGPVSAGHQNQLAERVGQVPYTRTRCVFRALGSIPAIPGSEKAPRTRWRFVFHSSPWSSTIRARFLLLPQDDAGAGGATAPPQAYLEVADGPGGSVIGVARARWGASPFAPSVIPSNFGLVEAQLRHPVTEEIAVSLQPDTDYFCTFGELDSARIVAADVWETVRAPHTDDDYPALDAIVTGPILDEDRADIARVARTAWRRHAAPLLQWHSELDSAARTRSGQPGGAAFANLVTGSAVSAERPRYDLDLERRSTLRRYPDVPVRVWIYATGALGDTGRVQLTDIGGTPRLVVPINDGGPKWYSAAGHLPAGDTKWELQYGGNQNALTVYAVSVHEYDHALDVGLTTDAAAVGQGTPVQLTAQATSHGADASALSMTIDIDDAVTTSLPAVVANPDSWSVSVIVAPASGVQWRIVLTRASLSADTPSSVVLATVPATVGRFAATASIVDGGGSKAVASTSLAVFEPDLICTVSADDNPADAGGTLVRFHVQVLGSQTNIQLIVSEDISGGGLPAALPLSLVDDAGWSVTFDEFSTAFVAELASAPHGATYDLVFAIPGSATAGHVTFQQEEFFSDELIMYGDGMGTMDDYRLNFLAAGPSWTVDALQGGSYPADAAEWAAVLASDPRFAGWQVPDHVHTCQDVAGGAVDTVGTDHLTESGAHTYQVSVPGYSRKGIRITAGATSFLQSTKYNPATESQLVIMVMGTPTTLGGRFFAQYGVNATIGARLLTSGANLAIASGGSTIAGTAASSAIRPYWIQYARASAAARGGDGTQVIAPAYNASASGALTAIGGVPSGASGGPVIVYIARWVFAKGEKTPAQIANLLAGLKW